MSDLKKIDQGMTVVEATEKLEEFKQKLIDESYQELVEDGEVLKKVDIEVLEALEVVLYYIKAMQNELVDEEL